VLEFDDTTSGVVRRVLLHVASIATVEAADTESTAVKLLDGTNLIVRAPYATVRDAIKDALRRD
jgi:hypothetical protein